MKSITKNQLAALLVISDIFMLFCFEGGISLWSFAGFLTGISAQAFLAFPLVKFADSGGKTEKWAEIFYFAYLTFWGGFLLNRIWNAGDTIFVPYETSGGLKGRLLITGMISLVCLYISSTGMKAASRSAVIAAGFGVIFLLTDFVSAVKSSNFGNISASLSSGTFIEGIYKCFAVSGGIGTGAVLAPLVNESCKKGAKLYFSCRFVLSAALMLTALLVTGGIMQITDFPVIMAVQLSQPFTSQRIDSVFMILFAVFAVFSVTAEVMTASYLLGEIVPKFRKWRSTAVILLTISAAFALYKIPVYSVWGVILTTAAEFAVPLIMLIRRKNK